MKKFARIIERGDVQILIYRCRNADDAEIIRLSFIADAGMFQNEFNFETVEEADGRFIGISDDEWIETCNSIISEIGMDLTL